MGGPWPIEWKGKTYQMGRPNPAAIEAIENEIARDAWDEANTLESFAPGALADVRDKLLTRQHRAGGPLFNATFRTSQGGLLQLWSLVRLHHPEFTRAEAAAMNQDIPDQVELALIMANPGFFEQVGVRSKMPHARQETKAAELRERAGKLVEQRN